MLLAATNSGTLIIALPDLERSLHTSLLALVWVILAYLISADRAGADGRPPQSTCSAASRPTSAGFALFASRRSAQALPPTAPS